MSPACSAQIRHFLSGKASLFLPAFLAILCLSTPSGAADSVTWMEAEAPPFFIQSGPDKGQGYENLVTDIIQENLPQYTHHTVTATISRHYRNFKNREKVCNVALYTDLVNLSWNRVFFLTI